MPRDYLLSLKEDLMVPDKTVKNIPTVREYRSAKWRRRDTAAIKSAALLISWTVIAPIAAR